MRAPRGRSPEDDKEELHTPARLLRGASFRVFRRLRAFRIHINRMCKGPMVKI